MPPLKVDPSKYDAFRVDVVDVAAQESMAQIEAAARQIIVAVGEDPNRPGLLRTPERVGRAYQELTAGYHVDPVKLINDAIFDVNYDEMVVVRDIDFYSLCEHHLLPFFGRCHVGYIPDGRVIGLSKIPRIVEMFARRLQLQERMTQTLVVKQLPVNQISEGQIRSTKALVEPDTEVVQGRLGRQTSLKAAQIVRTLPIETQGVMQLVIGRLDDLADAR